MGASRMSCNQLHLGYLMPFYFNPDLLYKLKVGMAQLSTVQAPMAPLSTVQEFAVPGVCYWPIIFRLILSRRDTAHNFIVSRRDIAHIAADGRTHGTCHVVPSTGGHTRALTRGSVHATHRVECKDLAQ